MEMLKRKIYSELVRWKAESKGKSALLIEGARRVGKTMIAEAFGKSEFPSFKTIDFSRESEELKNVFDDLSRVDIFFERLFLALGISPLPKGSLLIFDEVQFCPKARQAIKTLVADGRYYYVETGSLVSIRENTESILIPSEEESIQMCPLDYEEFLWACGLEFEAKAIVEHLNNRVPFDEPTHKRLLSNFRNYLAIGGMPQVVKAYLETHDLYAVDRQKRQILKLYEDDLRKIDSRFGTICHMVWTQIPAMLSKHSTRFIVSSTNERADSVLFNSTMEKLIESKTVIAVYKANDPSVGFSLTKDIGSFKLYFCDVGLFTSIVYANSPKQAKDVYQRLVFDKLKTNLGMLFENAAAQILTANFFEPYYYSWEQSQDGVRKRYEIDFLVSRHGKTIPFEVKSRDVSSKESLELFGKRFPKRVGEKYIVANKQFSSEGNLTYLPYYMLFALD